MGVRRGAAGGTRRDRERESDHPRRQPGGAQGAAPGAGGARGVHLHRPALQHGRGGVGVQRQRELAAAGAVAGRGGGAGGQGPLARRQVALHDVPAAAAAAAAAGARRGDLHLHRRQRAGASQAGVRRDLRGAAFRGADPVAQAHREVGRAVRRVAGLRVGPLLRGVGRVPRGGGEERPPLLRNARFSRAAVALP